MPRARRLPRVTACATARAYTRDEASWLSEKFSFLPLPRTLLGSASSSPRFPSLSDASRRERRATSRRANPHTLATCTRARFVGIFSSIATAVASRGALTVGAGVKKSIRSVSTFSRAVSVLHRCKALQFVSAVIVVRRCTRLRVVVCFDRLLRRRPSHLI